MSEWTIVATLALGSVVALYIGQQALRRHTPYPLPPGPVGLPWVGNVISVDAGSPWRTYAKWSETYGSNLVYSKLLGNDIIIINSEKIAKDLLENRSKNYSDRPSLPTTDLCGQGFNSVFLPYGDRWRLHRRFFHQTFRSEAVHRFLPSQHRKACHLLRRLLLNPEKLEDHVFEYTAGIIMNSTYDYDPASRKDELVDLVARVLSVTVPLTRPDVSFTIGAFPWVLYLPSWFPGMSFKKKMALAGELSKQFIQRPFEHALQKASDSTTPSLIHDALQGMEEKGTSPEEPWMVALKEAAGSVFAAASETSNSVLMSFFLMMMVNQEAQAKAQAQIDSVVGRDKLPTMDDRPFLPFIDAIFRETMRYAPVAPLALPHTAMDDDVYEGFLIPKGTIILVNLWAMAHDESKFPNSHAFIPERFLNDDGSLKSNGVDHIAYSFGRRICVGRHFADASVWSVIAKVLAVFKILRPLDENGLEIPVEPLFLTGSIVRPVPFKFRIVPRFPDMDPEKLDRLIAVSTP